ncbi:hypothetical protein EMIT0158MI4_70233 [Burkholderia ambifaria]
MFGMSLMITRVACNGASSTFAPASDSAAISARFCSSVRPAIRIATITGSDGGAPSAAVRPPRPIWVAGNSVSSTRTDSIGAPIASTVAPDSRAISSALRASSWPAGRKTSSVGMVVRKGEGDRFTVALAAANRWPFAGEGDRLTVALAMANRWPLAGEGDWLTVAQAAANRPRVTAGSRSR